MFERMSWTDILASVAGAAGVALVFWEIARRQRKLRDLFDVLDGDDAKLTDDLEHLVASGALRPITIAA